MLTVGSRTKEEEGAHELDFNPALPSSPTISTELFFFPFPIPGELSISFELLPYQSEFSAEIAAERRSKASSRSSPSSTSLELKMVRGRATAKGSASARGDLGFLNALTSNV